MMLLRSHPVVLWCLVVWELLRSADASDTECKILCMEDGACRKGQADFSDQPKGADGEPFHFHTLLDHDGEYCECPAQFTGLLCDVPYTECPAENKTLCYHGGKCVGSKIVVGQAYQTTYFCDCREARTQDSQFAVGAHCEVAEGHETVTTCNKEGNAFCANGGKCNDGADQDVKPCICPENYSGNYCELHKDDVSKMPKCEMNCHHHGVCQSSLRTPTVLELEVFGSDFEPNDVANFQHCRCKNRWMGRNCEHKYTPCGDKLKCVYGAECITYEDQPVCDCTTTTPKHKIYGGRQCEHEASSFCQKSLGVNGYEYCTNGGKCLQNQVGVFGCNCPDGFSGPHCEFTPDQAHHAPDPNECTLECRNGGECRVGLKDHGVLKAFEDLEEITGTRGVNMQHCVCPQGWGGVMCDTKVEVCGANEHVCLYGGKCEQNRGEDSKDFGCDCGAADQKVAGIHCQHKATSSCAEGHFCTNGGACGPANTCECPTRFSGTRCDVDLSIAQVENYDDDVAIYAILNHQENDGHSGQFRFGIIFGSVLAGLGGVALAVSLVYRYERSRNAKELDSAQNDFPTPPKEAFGRQDLASLQDENISPFGEDGDVDGVNTEELASVAIEYEEAGREQQLKDKHELQVI